MQAPGAGPPKSVTSAEDSSSGCSLRVGAWGRQEHGTSGCSHTQGTCPVRLCQASCFWRARRWQGRRAPKSLCHIIYLRRDPISPRPSSVQDPPSLFRLGLVSAPSVRATALPSREQVAVLRKGRREGPPPSCAWWRVPHVHPSGLSEALVFGGPGTQRGGLFSCHRDDVPH